MSSCPQRTRHPHSITHALLGDWGSPPYPKGFPQAPQNTMEALTKAQMTGCKAQGRIRALGYTQAARLTSSLARGYNFCPFQVKLKNFPSTMSTNQFKLTASLNPVS